MMARLLGKVAGLVLLPLVVWMFLSGCSGSLLSTPAPLPTSTPTKTVTATPTIVWFPPTLTPTIRAATPRPTATPEMHPDLDEIVISDSFTTEDNWQTRRTLAGNISSGYGELTIAVTQPRVTFTSLRQGYFPNDYYVEMSAVPSLCRSEDMYGLLLRATSEQDHYRFALNCAGQIRLDWVKGGQSIPIYNWMMSGQIQPGPIATPRLGVWVKGDEMRFFINDVFQFKAEQLAVTDGTLGVFGRAAGDTALTINFSDMRVWSLSD